MCFGRTREAEGTIEQVGVTKDVFKEWFKRLQPNRIIRQLAPEWVCPECKKDTEGEHRKLSKCHLVPKAALAEIANHEGQVQYFDGQRQARLFHLGLEPESTLEAIGPQLQTIGNATTEQIWCAAHDDALFSTVEKGATWEGTRKQCQAVTRRAHGAAWYQAWRTRRFLEEIASRTDAWVKETTANHKKARSENAEVIEAQEKEVGFAKEREQQVESCDVNEWSFIVSESDRGLPILGPAWLWKEELIITLGRIPGDGKRNRKAQHPVVIATPNDAERVRKELQLDGERETMRPEWSGDWLAYMLANAYMLGAAMDPQWYDELPNAAQEAIRNGQMTRIMDRRWFGPWKIIA